MHIVDSPLDELKEFASNAGKEWALKTKPIIFEPKDLIKLTGIDLLSKTARYQMCLEAREWALKNIEEFEKYSAYKLEGDLDYRIVRKTICVIEHFINAAKPHCKIRKV